MSESDIPIIPRFVENRIRIALTDTPAIYLHGPRQCGKTTAAKLACPNHTYITFDDVAVVEAAKADPRGFIDALPEYVILDEVQRAPFLFTSIKRAIDENRKPGRFVLTGSANLLLLPAVQDSLAGRMEIIRMYPFSACELSHRKTLWIDGFFKEKPVFEPAKRLDDEEFVQLIVRGWFPEAITRASVRRRDVWYGNYVDAIIQRDIKDISRAHAFDQYPLLLKRLAETSGDLINVSQIGNAFKQTRPTVDSYIVALNRLFLVEFLQPWSKSTLNRLVKTPKIHLADTGLLCAVRQLKAESLKKERSVLGHIAETFVFSELLKRASFCEEGYRFYHYRDRDMKEVDVVVENEDGRLIGFEIKLAQSVFKSDFSGLHKLKNVAGDAFQAGYLFYSGPDVLSFGDGMLAVPMWLLTQ